jgi:hypothetical protein
MGLNGVENQICCSEKFKCLVWAVEILIKKFRFKRLKQGFQIQIDANYASLI